MTISFDHVNIVQNMLFMFTSLHKGVSVFDFCMIFVDIINLSFFQYMLLNLYTKFRGKNSSEIRNFKDRVLL